ncbi:MAG: DUF2339 domain-containing protein [Clostridium sp.]|nr:DUF2339 domain-containing protein [Clostridium sp.]
MDERNQGNNQNRNDMDRARMLRMEAMYLEQKERVRLRLEYLMGISEDEQYDRYLAQMLKDLESGKATPAQVEKEAYRSYGEYRRKMAQIQSQRLQTAVQSAGRAEEAYDRRQSTQRKDEVRDGRQSVQGLDEIGRKQSAHGIDEVYGKKPAQRKDEGRDESQSAQRIEVHDGGQSPQGADEVHNWGQSVKSAEGDYSQKRSAERDSRENNPKSTMEFKIGVHVFSIIGAIFVLAAFVILGFHFLGGLAQGLCLYGAAAALVILSEFVLGRKILKKSGEHGSTFTGVLTGAGIGGLYAANIINYLVLDTINGLEAMAVTLVIAIGTIFISRRRDSAAIKIFSLIGCYICFFPVKGFETEFNFLLIAGMLLVVNAACMFFPNRKYQGAGDAVHILLAVFFTAVLTGIAWAEGINSIYLAGYVATSFLFIDMFSLKRCMGKETELFPACCIGNGVHLVLLFFIGNFGPGVSNQPDMALFMHLTVEALLLAVCLVTFLLWEKEDGRRWAQLYYAAGIVLLLGSFSEHPLEVLFSGLFVLLAAILAAGYKENLTLCCFVTAWAGILAYSLSGKWYCWILAGALLLAAVRMKRSYLYQELLATAVVLTIWRIRFHYYIGREFALAQGWFYLVGAAVLLVLFLMFNHLPWLKGEKQRPYNIINVAVMVFFYLGVWFCYSPMFSSAMMALGAVTILVVFSGRYAIGAKGCRDLQTGVSGEDRPVSQIVASGEESFTAQANLPIRQKYWILTGFLTWFSLTGHYESPVIVSILLMVIALGCVGIGFKLKDKAERIYGLVMAAFVCLKLVLYDFREVETIYRVMVFLVVGIIALIISFIYVRLEKSMSGREMEKAANNDIAEAAGNNIALGIQEETADGHIVSEMQAEVEDKNIVAEIQVESVDSNIAPEKQVEVEDDNIVIEKQVEIAGSNVVHKMQAEVEDKNIVTEIQVESVDSNNVPEIQAENEII